MNTTMESAVKSTLHLPMSDAEKAAAIQAALPKLIKAVNKDSGKHKPHPKMIKGAAVKDKVAAHLDYTGYGKEMATDYLASLGAAAKTWQDRILNLVKTADDKGRLKALTGATWVAKSCKDDTARKSLMKRISEARRVFKAATIKGQAKVVKTLESAGTWHQKVSKMPKQSKAGRKAKPVATVEQAMASVEQAGNKLVGVAEGHEQVKAIKLGEVFGLIERLSIPDLVKVLDLVAGRLMVSLDMNYAAIGKEVTALRERQEQAAREAA